MNTLLVAVVILAIVAASAILVNTNIGSSLQKTMGMYSLGTAKQVMSSINSAMDSLILEADGKRTIVKDNVNGYFIVSGKTSEIKFVTQAMNVIEPGTQKYENGMIISSGPQSLAYEGDVDGDNEDEFVLENSAVVFAVEKIGSADEHDKIDMKSVISMIKNKYTGAIVESELDIEIDGSSPKKETGYTEIVSHTMAVSNSIVIHIDDGYDAIFTLGAGQDFVSLKVRVIQ
ncbi:MAG: hypothetical protein ABIG30_02415 [Candidatus Aenigmatarchaeota archaeon]